MFNGKYTHIKSIIEKVYRDYPFEEVFEDECKEWAYEILNKIGRSELFEDYTAEITVTDFMGELPDNISDAGISGIRDQETGIVLIPSTDIFISQNNSQTSTSGIINLGIAVPEEDEDDIVDIETEVASLPLNTYCQDYKYKIQGNNILCSIEDCVLEISYKGFPVWEDDGSPKIPDDTKVVSMVANYIAKNIARRLWFKSKISKQIYDDIDVDSLFDSGAARNRLAQPDIAGMESIRRNSTRLLPKPDQYSTGLRYLNEQERLREN